MKWLYSAFVLIGVFILCLILLFKTNSGILFGSKEDQNQVSVYLVRGLNDTEITSAMENIQHKLGEQWSSNKFLSVMEQMTELEKKTDLNASGSFSEEELNQVISPLVMVTLKPDFNSQTVLQDLKQIKNVDDVVYGGDWLKKFVQLRSFINTGLNILFSILALTIFSLMTYSVHHYLLEDQENISILAMLGLKPLNLVWRYALELFYLTVVPMIVSMGFSYLFYVVAKKQVARNENFSFISDRLTFISVSDLFTIFICLMVALVVSLFIFNRSVVKKYYVYE